MLQQLDFEVTRFTVYRLYFAECFELYIQVPADLDQFR